MPTKKDFEYCVMHAGSDTIHKLPVEREIAPGRGVVVNHTRTACGALTTHMNNVSPEYVLEAPEACRCDLCFD